MYAGHDKKKLKREADEEYNEMEIAVKIAYPFRQTVHFTVGERKKIEMHKRLIMIYI